MKTVAPIRTLALMLLASAGLALAQVPEPAVEVKATTVDVDTNLVEFIPLPDTVVVPVAGTNAEERPNLISVTLDDVALEDVVRMFTRISGANIIASATNLDGRVTVNLTDVEWKPALSSILDMHNLMLVEKTPGTEVYSIVPRAADAPEPMLIRTKFLSYASVAEVANIVSNMLAMGGSVSPFPSRNALVLKTTAANHVQIDAILGEIDLLREQVFIEAKFMELNDQAIRDLGISWQVLEGYGLSAGSLNLKYSNQRTWNDERTDGSRAWDNRGQDDDVRDLYNMYDDKYQVESVEIIERPDGSFVEQTKLDPTREIQDKLDTGLELAENLENVFAKSIADVRTAVLSADDFRLVLSALKQMDGVSIVSNPKIVVANEESAVIHIGQTERPFISTITPATESSAPFVTFNPGEPVDFGVKLVVTPTINTKSNITVRIQPELTRFVRDAQAPNGQTYPIIATKKIETVFCLENGKTVAIGGLTETQERDQTKKVPFFGDIPLLGKYLFSHTHREKSQQETIIFVTLGVASPHGIESKEGIPEDAQLVHRKLLQQLPRRKKLEAELEDLIKKLESSKTSDRL